MQFPRSCLKNTENACRYLFDLQEIPGDTLMVHKLISYLVKNFNTDTGMWNNITVPDGNNYPHAPWWEHEDEEEYVPKNRTEPGCRVGRGGTRRSVRRLKGLMTFKFLLALKRFGRIEGLFSD